MNISSYLPLSGSTYIKLPSELKHPTKALISVKNNDNKCFLWCHFRHLNCEDVKLSRITKKDKEIAEGLNYSGVNVSVGKKDYDKISVMNGIDINFFCYENKVVFPVYLSDQSFNDTLDLLLISDGFTNHYVYIKHFNRFMFNKNKCKNKKRFCQSCLQCFNSEKVLLEHGKDCLMINCGQNVKLEKAFIGFKNYSRQIPVPLKICADFECLLKDCDSGINNDCFTYTSKYKDHIPCSFAYKLVCVDDKFSKDVVLYRGKNGVYKFIQSYFREYNYCRIVMKRHFNKNLVMTVEENEEFEGSNICWICGKLIKNDNIKELVMCGKCLK